MHRDEINAYIGRRARLLRSDGSILIGTIKESSIARIAVVGKTLARHIRYEDVLRIEPAPKDACDTD
jgi:hypothetical protein